MRPFFAVLLFLAMFAFAGQIPPPPVVPPPPNPDAEERLPNGKSKKEEMAKEDYGKSVEDARALVKLAEGLQSDLEKNDRYVVSVSEIRKTEEIEKLAKRIRGRLKGY